VSIQRYSVVPASSDAHHVEGRCVLRETRAVRCYVQTLSIQAVPQKAVSLRTSAWGYLSVEHYSKCIQIVVETGALMSIIVRA
jgi:hypothetical protein